MPVIELSPELATKINARYETVDAKGMLRLADILLDASADPVISSSEVASRLLDVIYHGLVSDSIHAHETHGDAFNRLLKVFESHKNSAAASGSHAGRRETESYARKLFVQHDGQWGSIAEAIGSLKTQVVAYSKTKNRSLTETNAESTIRQWLSKYLAESEEARQKLKPKARARLRRC